MISLTLSTNMSIDDTSILKGLEDQVKYALKQIKRDHCQLGQIGSNYENPTIRRQVISFLTKNEKLQEIATDLINKINKLQSVTPQNQVIIPTEELTEQYMTEVELLHDMHFAVSKTYTAFINHYFQSRIIPMTSMAA